MAKNFVSNIPRIIFISRFDCLRALGDQTESYIPWFSKSPPRWLFRGVGLRTIRISFNHTIKTSYVKLISWTSSVHHEDQGKIYKFEVVLYGICQESFSRDGSLEVCLSSSLKTTFINDIYRFAKTFYVAGFSDSRYTVHCLKTMYRTLVLCNVFHRIPDGSAGRQHAEIVSWSLTSNRGFVWLRKEHNFAQLLYIRPSRVNWIAMMDIIQIQETILPSFEVKLCTIMSSQVRS